MYNVQIDIYIFTVYIHNLAYLFHLNTYIYIYTYVYHLKLYLRTVSTPCCTHAAW